MSRSRESELLFEELVARHTDVVFHMARAWSGNASDAEELTQLAFIKAHRAFDRFSPGTNFKAWVLRILRNTFLDHQRKRGRQPNLIPLQQAVGRDEPEAGSERVAAMDIESKEVFYDLFGDNVARALKQLRPEHQLTVLLFDVEGLTYREIAELLETPPGTIRTWIHRGRIQLHKRLVAYARKLGYVREGCTDE